MYVLSFALGFIVFIFILRSRWFSLICLLYYINFGQLCLHVVFHLAFVVSLSIKIFPDLRGIPPMTSCSVSANVPLQFGWIRTRSRSSVCQSPFTCKKQKPSCKWLKEKGDFIGKKLGKLTDLRESLRNSHIFRDLRKSLGPGVSCCWLTLATPNSCPFSSVTQEATEFLSLASGKHFKGKLISLA